MRIQIKRNKITRRAMIQIHTILNHHWPLQLLIAVVLLCFSLSLPSPILHDDVLAPSSSWSLCFNVVGGSRFFLPFFTAKKKLSTRIHHRQCCIANVAHTRHAVRHKYCSLKKLNSFHFSACAIVRMFFVCFLTLLPPDFPSHALPDFFNFEDIKTTT